MSKEYARLSDEVMIKKIEGLLKKINGQYATEIMDDSTKTKLELEQTTVADLASFDIDAMKSSGFLTTINRPGLEMLATILNVVAKNDGVLFDEIKELLNTFCILKQEFELHINKLAQCLDAPEVVTPEPASPETIEATWGPPFMAKEEFTYLKRAFLNAGKLDPHNDQPFQPFESLVPESGSGLGIRFYKGTSPEAVAEMTGKPDYIVSNYNKMFCKRYSEEEKYTSRLFVCFKCYKDGNGVLHYDSYWLINGTADFMMHIVADSSDIIFQTIDRSTFMANFGYGFENSCQSGEAIYCH